jgi:hypothetical protein
MDRRLANPARLGMANRASAIRPTWQASGSIGKWQRGRPPARTDSNARVRVAGEGPSWDGRKIVYAYPFSGAKTEHRVELHGHKLNALCAIDALGVGGMYQTDVTVVSSCRFCGTDIEVRTAQNGKALGYARLAGAVVWYDLAHNHTAATSCCPSIGFFCCDEHLQQWLTAQTSRRAGYRLALDEALEVGRAIFEPVLAFNHTRP